MSIQDNINQMKISSPISLIKKSFQIYFKKENLVYFLKIYSLVFLVALVSQYLGQVFSAKGYAPSDYGSAIASGDLFSIFYLIGWSIISIFLNTWIISSTYLSIIRVVDGGVLDFKATYSQALKFFWRMIGLTLLVYLIIIGGVILLVIPAIIFGVWFIFAHWNLFSKNMSVIQSLKESKKIIKGKFWAVLGRVIVFLIFAFVVQLPFGLIPAGYGGVIFTIFGGLLFLPYYLLYQEASRLSGSTS